MILVPISSLLGALPPAEGKGGKGNDDLLHTKRFSLFYLRATLVATRVCG